MTKIKMEMILHWFFMIFVILFILICDYQINGMKIGFQCHHEMDCTDYIKGSSCSMDGYCECAPYFVQYNETTCLPSQLLGSDCVLPEQCSMKVANSSCLDGACRCVEGFLQFRKHTCLGPARPGAVCYSNAHCEMFSTKSHCDFLIPNLFGRCQCTSPARQVGGNCLSVDEEAATSTPSPLSTKIISSTSTTSSTTTTRKPITTITTRGEPITTTKQTTTTTTEKPFTTPSSPAPTTTTTTTTTTEKLSTPPVEISSTESLNLKVQDVENTSAYPSESTDDLHDSTETHEDFGDMEVMEHEESNEGHEDYPYKMDEDHVHYVDSQENADHNSDEKDKLQEEIHNIETNSGVQDNEEQTHPNNEQIPEDEHSNEQITEEQHADFENEPLPSDNELIDHKIDIVTEHIIEDTEPQKHDETEIHEDVDLHQFEEVNVEDNQEQTEMQSAEQAVEHENVSPINEFDDEDDTVTIEAAADDEMENSETDKEQQMNHQEIDNNNQDDIQHSNEINKHEMSQQILEMDQNSDEENLHHVDENIQEPEEPHTEHYEYETNDFENAAIPNEIDQEENNNENVDHQDSYDNHSTEQNDIIEPIVHEETDTTSNFFDEDNEEGSNYHTDKTINEFPVRIDSEEIEEVPVTHDEETDNLRTTPVEISATKDDETTTDPLKDDLIETTEKIIEKNDALPELITDRIIVNKKNDELPPANVEFDEELKITTETPLFLVNEIVTQKNNDLPSTTQEIEKEEEEIEEMFNETATKQFEIKKFEKPTTVKNLIEEPDSSFESTETSMENETEDDEVYDNKSGENKSDENKSGENKSGENSNEFSTEDSEEDSKEQLGVDIRETTTLLFKLPVVETSSNIPVVQTESVTTSEFVNSVDDQDQEHRTTMATLPVKTETNDKQEIEELEKIFQTTTKLPELLHKIDHTENPIEISTTIKRDDGNDESNDEVEKDEENSVTENIETTMKNRNESTNLISLTPPDVQIVPEEIPIESLSLEQILTDTLNAIQPEQQTEHFNGELNNYNNVESINDNNNAEIDLFHELNKEMQTTLRTIDDENLNEDDKTKATTTIFKYDSINTNKIPDDNLQIITNNTNDESDVIHENPDILDLMENSPITESSLIENVRTTEESLSVKTTLLQDNQDVDVDDDDDIAASETEIPINKFEYPVNKESVNFSVTNGERQNENLGQNLNSDRKNVTEDIKISEETPSLTATDTFEFPASTTEDSIVKVQENFITTFFPIYQKKSEIELTTTRNTAVPASEIISHYSHDSDKTASSNIYAAEVTANQFNNNHDVSELEISKGVQSSKENEIMETMIAHPSETAIKSEDTTNKINLDFIETTTLADVAEENDDDDLATTEFNELITETSNNDIDTSLENKDATISDNLVINSDSKEKLTAASDVDNNANINGDYDNDNNGHYRHETTIKPEANDALDVTTEIMMGLASRTTVMEPLAPITTTLSSLMIDDDDLTKTTTASPTTTTTTTFATTRKPILDVHNKSTIELRKRVDLGDGPVSLGLPCISDKQCQLSDTFSYCNEQSLCDCTSRNYGEQNKLCNAHKTGCSPGTFQCRSSGVCISWFFVCDGRPDCTDASDEECQHNPNYNQYCPQQSFHCFKSNRCISRAARCDGKRQCPNGEDELNCNSSNNLNGKCPDNTYRCKSGECLPEYEYCNAIISCKDGSDEPPHLCGSRSVPNFFLRLLTSNVNGATSSSNFNNNNNSNGNSYCPHRCNNGRCRSSAIVCSGRDGCGDGTDEETCSVCRCPAPIYSELPSSSSRFFSGAEQFQHFIQQPPMPLW